MSVSSPAILLAIGHLALLSPPSGLSEWHLYKRMQFSVDITKGGSIGWYHNPCVLTVAAVLRRKEDHFVSGVGSTTLVLVGSSCFAFAIPVTDVADRLSITGTIMLALVAFKLFIAETIPKVPYQTAGDRFVVVSFVVCFLISLEMALLGVMSRASSELGDEDGGRIDAIAAAVLISVYILFVGHEAWTMRKRIRKADDAYGEKVLDLPDELGRRMSLRLAY